MIQSKLLTRKIPKILEAITFSSQGIQSGLKDVEILDGITLNKGEDLFKKLIECRFALQKNNDKTSNQLQKILKIIANSTCYGKFIQLNTRKTILKKNVTVHGLDTFDVETNRMENPDKFFHPIISVFLTAGSRLILAAAEHLLEKNNGDIVAYMRDSGGEFKIHTSTSKDDGQTWSPAKYIDIPNPNSSVEVKKLANGDWAMVCNDLPNFKLTNIGCCDGRQQLSLYISKDEGMNWAKKMMFEDDSEKPNELEKRGRSE